MNPQDYLDSLSTHLKNTIAKSISFATSIGEDEVSPAHIMHTLAGQKGSIGSEILSQLEITPEEIEEVIGVATETDKVSKKESLPELNENSKKALEKAMLLAHKYDHNYIGTEHLISGLVHCDDNEIESILKYYEISKKEVDKQVEIVLKSTTRFPNIDNISETLDQIQNISNNAGGKLPPGGGKGQMKPKLFSKKTKGQNKDQSALEMFTTELTDKEHQEKVDPVIGREKEIERMINIICRRNKNNPVLVGEPGVGKTAIVEGLAKKITEGDVPDALKRKKIFSLDLSLLISGTIYRGEFESRLNKIIEKFTDKPDYILFIDELHNIIGAGSNQGTMDAANILKPALARGELHCIGATTLDEYKKYITDDPALERRFQSIDIDEPTIDETEQILNGVKKYYEGFHNVDITEEAIKAAAKLSTKYIHDNFLPDKAIDLIDEASSSVKVKQADDELAKKKRELQDLLEDYEENKEASIEKEEFEDAIKWKNAIENTNEKLEKVNKKVKEKRKKTDAPKVTAANIAEILSTQLAVDSEVLLKDQWSQLDDLPEKIRQDVIGQDHVIEKVTKALKKSYLGIHDQNKPIGSYLFVGPSGVGKTEMSKSLAKNLYHDQDSLIKIDMSEFSEAHGVSKLLGSPAGYVGHDKRNKFLEKVQKRPYSIILVDEFDKAHPDVQKLMLQILDEGKLTDSSGKTISFKHTIIILTTNVGAELYKSHSIGFGGEKGVEEEKKENFIKSKLKNTFSSPLIGRLNEICLFSPLEENDIEMIVEKHVKEIGEKLQEKHGISLEATNDAIESLANEQYDSDTGIRHLEQIIDETVQNLLIEKLKEDKNKKSLKLRKRGDSYKLS